MEFDPPIASRSTDQLIEIANFSENWNSSAVEQAQRELTNRGISSEQQQKKVTEWGQLFQEEQDAELIERAIERYGILQLIWMTIKWPYTILWDWSLRKEGYIRMHKERLYSIGAGIMLWILMLVWVNIEYDLSQRRLQNEINNVDIYEWEKNNYTDEEITKFRSESIEKVIRTLRTNVANGTPTYLILDKDTISNYEVEKLRNLDMLNIRDVVFEGDFEPETHEWITIKLVKPADNRR